MKRRRMSKSVSRKSFRKKSGVHPRNKRPIMRGGYRF